MGPKQRMGTRNAASARSRTTGTAISSHCREGTVAKGNRTVALGPTAGPRRADRARALLDRTASQLAVASRAWIATMSREGWRFDAEFLPRQHAHRQRQADLDMRVRRLAWERLKTLCDDDATRRIRKTLPQNLLERPDPTLLGPVTRDGKPTRSKRGVRWLRLVLSGDGPLLQITHNTDENETTIYHIVDERALGKESPGFVRALHAALTSGAACQRLTAAVQRYARMLRLGAQKPETAWGRMCWDDVKAWMRRARPRRTRRGAKVGRCAGTRERQQ